MSSSGRLATQRQSQRFRRKQERPTLCTSAVANESSPPLHLFQVVPCFYWAFADGSASHKSRVWCVCVSGSFRVKTCVRMCPCRCASARASVSVCVCVCVSLRGVVCVQVSVRSCVDVHVCVCVCASALKHVGVIADLGLPLLAPSPGQGFRKRPRLITIILRGGKSERVEMLLFRVRPALDC